MAPAVHDLTSIATDLLGQIDNPNTRGMYCKALTDFFAWWMEHADLPFDRVLLEAHLEDLIDRQYSPATINQRLAAIRKLVAGAAMRNLLDFETVAGLIRVKGSHACVVPRGKALTTAQTEALINAPEPSSAKGVRDRALLAVLVGCGLLRSELVRVNFADVQKADGGSILIEIRGKGGRVRAVNVPRWVKLALDAWTSTAKIRTGPLFRAVDRTGTVKQRALSAQSVLAIVVAYGRSIGVEVKPDDLRRTCAQLCHERGGDLRGIQLLLGHASIQTTERFLSTKRGMATAVNDRLRMKWYEPKRVVS